MNNLKRLLILLITIFSLFIIGCSKKEEIFVIESKSVEIKDGVMSLEYGDTVILTAYYKKGNNELPVKVNNSNEMVLEVKENNFDYQITALDLGSEVITFIYTEGEKVIYESVEIKVEERKEKIERLLISSRNVVSSEGIINVSVDAYGKKLDENIIYESSDEEIAIIDEDGVVYGISEGVCTIKATLESDESVYDTMQLHVFSFDKETMVNGGKYTVDTASKYVELPYGVKFQKVDGLSSTPLDNIDVDGYTGLDETIVANQLYPQQISLLEVPSSKDVKITTWAKLEGHRWTLTTVRGLITNYEKHHPGWKVIAAINGDFFDINAKGNLPYQTTSSVVSDGEFYKTTASYMIGFKNDGSSDPLVGFEEIKRTEKMILAIYNEKDEIIKEFPIDKINSDPLDNETSIYFATYNSDKEIVPVTLNVLNNVFVVENAEYALPNNENDFYGKGVITKTESATLGKGSFAIVTHNSDISKLLSTGVKIRCQFEYVGAYEGINDIVGCRQAFLMNGEYEVSGEINDRAPRTCLGVKEDGTIVMMVIDGRQGGKRMFGADSREMASIMKHYGCVEAYNLDGGGSSTMIIREGDKFTVTNTPSDGRERSDGNCVLIVVKDVEFENEVTNISEREATINIKVKNDNQKVIKKLFISLDDKLYEVDEKGQVHLDNLVHNSTYQYKVFYENEKGELIETLSGYSFTTHKKMYKYLATYLIEKEETFEIVVNYVDEDKCSTISGGTIYLYSIKDGESCANKTFLKGNGRVELKKSIIGDKIEKLDLEFSYQFDNKNRETVKMDNIEYFYKDER